MPSKDFTDRMSASLGKTRKEKLQKAHTYTIQAGAIINRVVTVLEGDSTDRREAAKTLRGLYTVLQNTARTIEEAARDTGEMAVFTEQQSQIVDVATGEFRESAEILKQAAEIVQSAGYDLAHVETFLSAFREYLIGDPHTIHQALSLMDVPIVIQELVKLDGPRFKELEAAIESAAIHRVTLGKDSER